MQNRNISRYSPVYSPGNVSYNASNGVTTYGSPVTYVAAVLTYNDQANQTSVSTPGYEVLKKKGQLPLHPHSKGTGTIVYPVMTLYYSGTYTNGNWVRDRYIGPSRHFGADAEDTYTFSGWGVDNKALNRVYGEISLTKGSLAVTAAEFHKTAEHVARTATRLANAYLALKRGKVSEFADALGLRLSRRRTQALSRRALSNKKRDGNYREFASNTWLEYTYGWVPLLNDLHTQLENTANYLYRRSAVVREGIGSASEERSATLNSSPIGFPGKVTKTIRVRRRVRYVIRYAVPGGSNFLATYGITNPALVAWELVPFSFVVDWFLPVGNALEALTATHGLTFAGGTRSQIDVIDIVSTVQASAVPSGTNPSSTYSGSGEARNQKVLKNRSVLLDFPRPDLPALKDARSFSHAASAIALLNNIFLNGRHS